MTFLLPPCGMLGWCSTELNLRNGSVADSKPWSVCIQAGQLQSQPLWLLPLLLHIRFDFLSATVGHGKDSSLLLLESPVISESLQGVNTLSSSLLYWTHSGLWREQQTSAQKHFVHQFYDQKHFLTTHTAHRLLQTQNAQASPSLVIVEFAIFYPSFKPLCWRLCWCSWEVFRRGGGGWGQETHPG